MQGIIIGSGLAKGIDTVAHTTTLEYNGKTIAVLGNGFNYIFPKENFKLYEEILENGGLIISEYSPDTKAQSEYFLQRNRIVSGIAIGVLVIESKLRSGTSVTAKIAKEQGKKVFAIPHDIDDRSGAGTNQLIRKGGMLVTCTKDIIDEFDFLEYKEISKERSKRLITNKVLEIKFKDQEYQKVYDLITQNPISINEIYKKCKIELSKLNNILFMLEIEEYIEKCAGGYKCILSKN